MTQCWRDLSWRERGGVKVVPTVCDPDGPVQPGDIACWVLPAEAPQPYAGATLLGEGLDDEGRPAPAWYVTITQAGAALWPRPLRLVRGYVVDAGAGSVAW